MFEGERFEVFGIRRQLYRTLDRQLLHASRFPAKGASNAKRRQGRDEFQLGAGYNLWLTKRRYPWPLVIYIRDIRRLSLVAVITRINDALERSRANLLRGSPGSPLL